MWEKCISFKSKVALRPPRKPEMRQYYEVIGMSISPLHKRSYVELSDRTGTESGIWKTWIPSTGKGVSVASVVQFYGSD